MGQIVSPMAGNLWKVLVKRGDQVKVGQEVAILESMKMEIPVKAEGSGMVKALEKTEGEFVNEGDVLIKLD